MRDGQIFRGLGYYANEDACAKDLARLMKNEDVFMFKELNENVVVVRGEKIDFVRVESVSHMKNIKTEFKLVNGRIFLVMKQLIWGETYVEERDVTDEVSPMVKSILYNKIKNEGRRG